ncbi:MAG: septum formation initiator family protein [Cyclobacteriaceae bacterium]|jgi:cell division protein FtsB|nr:septum formation initiator family protein [Cyclobacteriaceae bacterium]
MAFLVWITFLDSNNLIARFSLTSKLNGLEREKEFYERKIEEVAKDQQELFGTEETLEKYAREKYLMKRESEDVFVIVEE